MVLAVLLILQTILYIICVKFSPCSVRVHMVNVLLLLLNTSTMYPC
jgi:hypothetical protein